METINNKVQDSLKQESGKTPAPERAQQVQRRPVNNMDTIDLVDLFFTLLSHWKSIILAMLLGAVIAGAFHVMTVRPLYQADASIYITNNESILSFQDLQLNSALTEDYTKIVKSRTVLKKVIDELGLDISYRQLSNLITVNTPADTRIVKMYVVCGDMELSKNIANALMNVSVDQIYKIVGNGEPTIIDAAEADAIIEITPSFKKYVVMGAMVGVMLMGGLFTLLFLLDQTIKTEEDIEKYTHLPNLAMIPYYEEKFENKKRGKKK